MNQLTIKKMMKITKTLSVLACSALLSLNALAQNPKLTDPEIASAAVIANQNDIGFAEIAKNKSKNADILKVADMMIKDHKSVIDQAVALVTKLKVTPKDNAFSKQLASDAEKTRKMLDSKSGKDFDKAYIDNEVTYHRAVISAVETVLIPQTQNGELKALLQQVVPVLKTHLEHAEMVQKTVSK
jgi:putative membrane protein